MHLRANGGGFFSEALYQLTYIGLSAWLNERIEWNWRHGRASPQRSTHIVKHAILIHGGICFSHHGSSSIAREMNYSAAQANRDSASNRSAAAAGRS